MEALFKYLLAISNKQKSDNPLASHLRGKTFLTSSGQTFTWRTVFLTLIFTLPQLAVFSEITTKKALAQSVCPAGTTSQILNWTPTSDRAGIEAQNPSLGDINASFQFTQDSSRVIDNEETRISSRVYGGLPGPNLEFNIGVGDNPAPPNGTAILTINFNQPVTLAAPLQLLDIDRNGERDIGFVYQDTVRVRASNNGNPAGVTLTAVGRDVRIVNNQARGIRENSFPNESDGNALAEVAGPVNQIQVIYTAGTEYGTPEQDETIGLARLRICAPPPGSNNTGFIGDTVFNDINGNGTQDEGEPVVPGVSLNLISPGADGQFDTDDDQTSTAGTAENGLYGFNNLPPGQYRVRVNPPDNLPQVTTNGGREVTVNLEPGQRREDIDFGLRGENTGFIGDTVFNDINGNGTQDEGEPVVPGVSLNLISPGADGQFDTDDDQTSTAGTAENGLYGFNNLPPGQYRVRVNPPDNLPQVTTNGGREVTVTLEPGQRRDDVDFGLRGGSEGSIRGTVFTDPNGNGVQDINNQGVPNSGENGIPNVTVTLRNSDGEVVATQTSDDDGNYEFTNLPLGEYTVTSGTPDSLSPTTETVLSANLTENNPDSNDLDFGFRPGRVGSGGDVNLRLVKRITNVFRNGQPIGGNFGSFIDDPNDDDDNIFNNSSQTSPVGVPQLENPVRSGDEVEYTIYYLTEGGEPLQNVRFCDLIPERTSFSPNSFGNATGIALRQGANNTVLSNAQDSDRGTFYSPLTPLSDQPGGDACSSQNNPNGAVIVNVGTITPNDNFGFFRFRVRID